MRQTTAQQTVTATKMVYPNGRCSLGNNCKAPTRDLAPRHKCHHCKVQLHPPPCGCSVFFGDDEDGVVTCHPDLASTKCAARRCGQPALEEQSREKKKPKLTQSCVGMNSESGSKPIAKKATRPGRKKGSKTESTITRG